MCWISGGPPSVHKTETASKRMVVTGGRFASAIQPRAALATSFRFAGVMASRGWPNPTPLRVFTSTKTRIRSCQMTRSISLRPNRTFRPRTSHPLAWKYFVASASPRRPSSALSNQPPALRCPMGCPLGVDHGRRHRAAEGQDEPIRGAPGGRLTGIRAWPSGPRKPPVAYSIKPGEVL